MEQFSLPSDKPVVSIEGRSPRPGQELTAQMYLAEQLTEAGVVPVFFRKGPTAFTAEGQIREFSMYDTHSGQAVDFTADAGLVPDAWRLRDATWPLEDKSAFRRGRGYNSVEFRDEFDNRIDQDYFLTVWNLGALSLHSMIPEVRVPEGEQIFIKPNFIDDIAEDQPGMVRRRARLVASTALQQELRHFDEDVVLQARQPTLPVAELMGELQVSPSPSGMLSEDSLHAVRLYHPLWHQPDQPVLGEIRLTNPWDVGQPVPSQLHLLEPQQILETFPGLGNAHRQVIETMQDYFGPLNLPAIDYLLTPDAEPRMVSVHRRAFTPELLQKSKDATELARRVVSAEVKKLVELAHS